MKGKTASRGEGVGKENMGSVYCCPKKVQCHRGLVRKAGGGKKKLTQTGDIGRGEKKPAGGVVGWWGFCGWGLGGGGGGCWVVAEKKAGWREARVPREGIKKMREHDTSHEGGKLYV